MGAGASPLRPLLRLWHHPSGGRPHRPPRRPRPPSPVRPPQRRREGGFLGRGRAGGRGAEIRRERGPVAGRGDQVVQRTECSTATGQSAKQGRRSRPDRVAAEESAGQKRPTKPDSRALCLTEMQTGRDRPDRAWRRGRTREAGEGGHAWWAHARRCWATPVGRRQAGHTHRRMGDRRRRAGDRCGGIHGRQTHWRDTKTHRRVVRETDTRAGHKDTQAGCKGDRHTGGTQRYTGGL